VYILKYFRLQAVLSVESNLKNNVEVKNFDRQTNRQTHFKPNEIKILTMIELIRTFVA
jgi:hypothetical protein